MTNEAPTVEELTEMFKTFVEEQIENNGVWLCALDEVSNTGKETVIFHLMGTLEGYQKNVTSYTDQGLHGLAGVAKESANAVKCLLGIMGYKFDVDPENSDFKAQMECLAEDLAEDFAED